MNGNRKIYRSKKSDKVLKKKQLKYEYLTISAFIKQKKSLRI